VAISCRTAFGWVGLGLVLLAGGASGQATDTERPLPDVAALMREVEVQQRVSEAVQKDYLFHSVEAVDELDRRGVVKKIEVKEYDVFWVNGVEVERLLKKDGRELSENEKKKEDERIDKEVAKAAERRAKADAQGKETGPDGEEEVTVSRMLELGRFTNARRVKLNGRDTIVVDYVGDPAAKTRTRFEAVIRDLVGTIWVDEQDHAIAQLYGRFVNDFKIGGGLLVNLKKGLTFSFEQARVNGEVWLPARATGEGSARALLFFNFNGRMSVEDSGYRKFKATSTIVPREAKAAGGAEKPESSGGNAPQP
jgi:hypothetical protein